MRINNRHYRALFNDEIFLIRCDRVNGRKSWQIIDSDVDGKSLYHSKKEEIKAENYMFKYDDINLKIVTPDEIYLVVDLEGLIDNFDGTDSHVSWHTLEEI